MRHLTWQSEAWNILGGMGYIFLRVIKRMFHLKLKFGTDPGHVRLLLALLVELGTE